MSKLSRRAASSGCTLNELSVAGRKTNKNIFFLIGSQTVKKKIGRMYDTPLKHCKVLIKLILKEIFLVLIDEIINQQKRKRKKIPLIQIAYKL